MARHTIRAHSVLVAYVVAVLLVATALLVRLFLNQTLGTDAPFLPFIMAIIGAAWYGGLRPGLVATFLGGVLATTLFFEPAYALPLTNVNKTLWLFTFFGIGGLISWLYQSLHTALQRSVESQRKEHLAEEKVRVSEARFRHAIEAAPFPAILHAEDGTILTMNRAWTELTGYTLEQIPSLAAWIEKVCDNKELAWGAVRRTFASEVARVDHGEISGVNAAQQRLVWDFSSALLGTHADGRRLAISMAKDITKRKQVEEELIRLNTAVESAANGIVIVDRAGVMIWVNPAFSKMTGYSKQEAIGQHTRLLKSGMHEQRFYRELWTTVLTGRVWRGVICNRRKDGSNYQEEMTITAIADARGKVVQFVAIKEDITAKQQLQTQLQQAQKMEAVGQLAGGVAHDFNNLLTIISGYSEILLGSLSPGDAHREPIKAINEASERAAGLTRQLLAFSRKTVLEPRTLNLNDVVHDTEKMLRRMIGEDILLTTVLDPQLAPVKVDPSQISQVLINLAVNARDAMPTGGKLSIETTTVTWEAVSVGAPEGVRPGRYVSLVVVDSGTGMSPDVKARIFEPFFTTKGVGKGTGLGLSVVMGIVQQSGGHVEVASELGVGTTFRIYLPAVPVPLADDTPDAPGSSLQGSETVCLVEDEESVKELARLAFQSHGYTILHAGNAREALHLLDAHRLPVDILVTDVVMPGMSGRELADLMLVRYPQLKVLFTSGYTDDAVVRHGILHAEVAFLQKPYTPMSLLRKVRQVLDRN